jgi:predicted Fe-S protein YdhL (DUF1289 family)
MKNKIIEVLKKNLSSVYCDSCEGEYCEGCNRKSMNWGISDDYVEKLANEILKEEAK